VVEAIFDARTSNQLSKNDNFRIVRLQMTFLMNQQQELFLLKIKSNEERILDE
jgi:hypothetical protein